MALKRKGSREDPVASNRTAGGETKRGRKRAKHSDPAYTQMSLYVPIDLRTKVKMRLLELSGEGIRSSEFSALIEELLKDWLKR
jgi:hypothetical protein